MSCLNYCNPACDPDLGGYPDSGCFKLCGRHENLYVIYFGKITAPSGVDQVSFAGNTDDGFRMYVDGQFIEPSPIDNSEEIKAQNKEK
jgi:hypothetical protein